MDNNDFLSHIRTEELPRGSKLKRFLRRTGLFFSFIIAIVAIATWLGSVVFSSPTDEDGWFRKTNHAGFFATLRSLIVNDSSKLDGAKADRINILFLGMGGPGHDGAFLTDTIILASIKPSTKEIALTSIPRDLSVPIPGYGWRKINHANAFGELKEPGEGARFAVDVIEQIVAQPIHYYIRMDFAGFEKLIDEVGGVDVVVERAFTDTRFPTADHKYQTVTFNAGPQHMNGKTALTFARSRHGNNTEGSDFARNRRQQKVIMAFKEKALSLSTLLNPARLSSMYDALAKHVDTNADVDTGIQLMRMVKDLDTSNMKSIVLTDAPGGLLTNGSGENAYMLLPRDRTFREIQNAIALVFDTASASTTPPSAKTLETANAYATAKKEVDTPLTSTPVLKSGEPFIEIQNGTWIVGLAAKYQSELELKGFTVSKIDNALNRPYTTSVVYDLSKGTQKEMASNIANLLQSTVSETVPPTKTDERTTILIILGTDKAEEE